MITKEESRAAWAKYAAKVHGWKSDKLPVDAEGEFLAGWQEVEHETFRAGMLAATPPQQATPSINPAALEQTK